VLICPSGHLLTKDEYRFCLLLLLLLLLLAGALLPLREPRGSQKWLLTCSARAIEITCAPQ